MWRLFFLCLFLASLANQPSIAQVYRITYEHQVVYETSDDVNGKFDDDDKLEISDLFTQPTYFELMIVGSESSYGLVGDKNLKLSMVKSPSKKHVMYEMGSGKVYRNYDDSLFLRHENVFGKKFIVKKEFRTPTWKLEPEQKEIDGILCKLATTQAFDTIVKAWYCTQYPIPNGPREFWGLPGLILQIQLPLLSMTAIRIEVLNEKIEIKKPKRGKVITEQEYRRIFNEKLGDFLAGDMRTRQKRE